MNYPETIDFLFTQLPMFSKSGSVAIKKGLDNILYLCDSLDNPHHKFKCVHVAGTNGKGSVSHILAAILQTAGYKTALYTSPHLIDFRERISVNGEMIKHEYVVEFVDKIVPQLNKIHPSFFEITVAMAFDYFATKQVDIAIIETGLGGRLDSTNIIHPILSVITNIAYDHTDLLGNTLALIAGEKAGIIKYNTPIVIGEVIPETKEIFLQKAIQENAPIFFAEETWAYISHHFTKDKFCINIQNIITGCRQEYELDLKGTYQIHNLITVLESVKQLNILGWNLSEENVMMGLCNTTKLTGLKGRWDIIQQNPFLVIDVGHNAHGITEVLKQIKNTVYNKLHIITGMVKDKDINSVLQLMPINATYYFTKAQISRALNEELLYGKAMEYNLKGKPFSTIHLAIDAALKNADNDDLIIICGSVFVAGEAYQYLSTLK